MSAAASLRNQTVAGEVEPEKNASKKSAASIFPCNWRFVAIHNEGHAVQKRTADGAVARKSRESTSRGVGFFLTSRVVPCYGAYNMWSNSSYCGVCFI